MLRFDGWNELQNCYAFALDDKQHRNWNEQQPGWHSGIPAFERIGPDDYRCGPLMDRILADGETFERASCTSGCPAGKRKIFLSVDPMRDYHLYREFAEENIWCHKLGHALPQCLPVGVSPWNISRKHPTSQYNYRLACGCLCI